MFFSIFIVIALSLNSLGRAADNPLSPEQYRDIIKQGFSTNWFKSCDPLSKYNDTNIDDIFNKGFRNLRLRARADLIYGIGPKPCNSMESFLQNLTTVVDKCLDVGIVPIISWIHHADEINATEKARENYVWWWTEVATQLREKDYRLSFNLFTELGIDASCGACEESLRRDNDKYNNWTRDVIAAIRKTGGKNTERILILGSPGKTAKDLHIIDKNIFNNDDYLMVEWHLYASGPNKNSQGSKKYWKDNGKVSGRQNVRIAIEYATNFTKNTNVSTYLGAWMPADNEGGSLSEYEVVQFGKYFAKQLKKEKIPWSLNVLDVYYNTKESEWIQGKQNISGAMIDMAKVLNAIAKVM
ncbi:uncharacterized protein LOC114524176 [Dendronephthya gigantea]|uniref:uncharacterized protein LOC114524176 n=1 Tax=Dendronephthya gigantea TaxID=151771 RepID=UPI00106CAEF8|nr:uncharacterized protein LOC114524176 [Dendronephthya gigantea]